MTSFKELQELIERVNCGVMSTTEVRGLLRHPSPLVRVNAITALANDPRCESGVIEDLVVAASAPENRVRLMGTISVAHVAVACLLRIELPQASGVAKSLISAWEEPDRAELIWYLQSEGLQLP